MTTHSNQDVLYPSVDVDESSHTDQDPASSAATHINDMSKQSFSNVIDSSLNKSGFGFYHFLISVICVAAWSADGSMPMALSLVKTRVHELWELRSYHMSMMVFNLYFGMLIGSLLFGWAADNFGRKRMLLLSNIGLFCSILVQSFSVNVWMFLVAVLMNGFFCGGNLPLVYSYYTEFLPRKGRGFYLTCLACSWSIGELLISGFSWAFMKRIGWRWVVRFSAWPCCLVFMMLPCSLKSPRYLLKRGHREKSAMVLKRIAKWNCSDASSVNKFIHEEYTSEIWSDSSRGSETETPTTPEDQCENSNLMPKQAEYYSQEEFQKTQSFDAEHNQRTDQTEKQSEEVSESLEVESQTKSNQYRYGKFVGLFTQGRWKATTILWGQWFFASISLYCIQVFLPEFFSKKGVEVGQYSLIFLSSLGNIPGVIVAATIIEFLGRKLTLSIFCILCGIALVPFGIFNNFWVMLVFLVFAKFFMYGLWGIIDILPSEIYPTEIRSVGNSSTNAMARIAGMVSSFLMEEFLFKFDSVWPSLGVGVAMIILTAIITILPLIPETKGKKIK